MHMYNLLIYMYTIQAYNYIPICTTLPTPIHPYHTLTSCRG